MNIKNKQKRFAKKEMLEYVEKRDNCAYMVRVERGYGVYASGHMYV